MTLGMGSWASGAIFGKSTHFVTDFKEVLHQKRCLTQKMSYGTNIILSAFYIKRYLEQYVNSDCENRRTSEGSRRREKFKFSDCQ